MSSVVCFRCAVCGTEVDIGTPSPWRCPKATDEDRHHVLQIVRRPGPLQTVDDPNPFVAFGAELAWQAFALDRGMTLDAAAALVRQVDERMTAVAGTGFVVTPFDRANALSELLGFTDEGGVWVKRYILGTLGDERTVRVLTQLGSVYAEPAAGRSPPRSSPVGVAACFGSEGAGGVSRPRR